MHAHVYFHHFSTFATAELMAVWLSKALACPVIVSRAHHLHWQWVCSTQAQVLADGRDSKLSHQGPTELSVYLNVVPNLVTSLQWHGWLEKFLCKLPSLDQIACPHSFRRHVQKELVRNIENASRAFRLMRPASLQVGRSCVKELSQLRVHTLEQVESSTLFGWHYIPLLQHSVSSQSS